MILNNINKIYIDLTTKCNIKCPFCLACSSPKNNDFITPETLNNILNEIERSNLKKVEIELSGGEPLLHPNFLNIIERILEQNFVKKVLIETNTILLNKYIESIKELSDKYKKEIVIKMSINYYLIDINTNHIEKIKEIIKNNASEYLYYFLSIRYRESVIKEKELLKSIYTDEILKNVSKNAYPLFNWGRTFNLDFVAKQSSDYDINDYTFDLWGNGYNNYFNKLEKLKTINGEN